MAQPFTRLHENKLYVVIFQDQWRTVKTYWAETDGSMNENCKAYIKVLERRKEREGQGEIIIKELEI